MLILKYLTVQFGRSLVLDGISLDVKRGEVVCLLGPSGSGKSTLLRAVAGIHALTRGQVFIDGTEVSGPKVFVEPERRRVGMVFQDYALFPHLTVAENVAFGLGKDRSAVPRLLARLELERLSGSYPHMLSGGESQRVALARAMAPGPRILLMDEPFSSLDSRLRDDVRRHTLDFIRETQTTTVIVTHDPEEAMRIGNRIALLEHGRLVQYGTPEELYSRPATLFAARFFSDVAVLPGTCRDGRLETSLGNFPAPAFDNGTEAVACLRPHHLRLAPQATEFAARIVASEFCGGSRHVLAKINNIETPVVLHASGTFPNADERFKPGNTIYLELSRDSVPVVAVRSANKEFSHAQ